MFMQFEIIKKKQNQKKNLKNGKMLSHGIQFLSNFAAVITDKMLVSVYHLELFFGDKKDIFFGIVPSTMPLFSRYGNF